MIFTCRDDIFKIIADTDDTAMQILLELIINEMAQHKWAEAKQKYINQILNIYSKKIDIHGTEYDHIIQYLTTPQAHIIKEECHG